MKLEILESWQVQEVRKWRNSELKFLRTPYRITEQMQEKFYDNVINDRNSNHRYFAIMGDVEEKVYDTDCNGTVGCMNISKLQFIGMGGLTNIEWENGCAEISLIIDPDYRGRGYGLKVVQLLLEEALKKMRLISVYGEVYDCGNVEFWEKVVKLQEERGNKTYITKLKYRKFWNGKMYDSMWFMLGGKE